jgi:nicotinamidase-related amidase
MVIARSAKEVTLLLDAARSALLLVDLQARLAPAIDDAKAAVDRVLLLLGAARRLDVPVLASEQYPKGLGSTLPAIRDRLRPAEIVEKLRFAGSAEPALGSRIAALGRPVIVVAGMEAHVCVLQTVLGLQASGLTPVLVADAVASRSEAARDLAIQRMRAAGVVIVNTEMVLFEWLGRADTPAFRDLLPAIRSGDPADLPVRRQD